MEKDERSETEPETNSDDNKVSFKPSDVADAAAAVGNNNVNIRRQLHHPSAEENKEQ